MTNQPLSPAAQTVLDAFLNGYICNSGHNVAFESDRNGLAAALVAVADRVVPLHTAQKEMRGHDLYRQTQRLRTRCDLLAIAAELKANEV